MSALPKGVPATTIGRVEKRQDPAWIGGKLRPVQVVRQRNEQRHRQQRGDGAADQQYSPTPRQPHLALIPHLTDATGPGASTAHDEDREVCCPERKNR
jgi:hypothetical protein